MQGTTIDMSDWIEPGAAAPDFTLPNHTGKNVKLSSLRGGPVVIYFYPEDDTPGCTIEACGFRDAHADFAQLGATVLGISPDPPAKHAAFREKYDLSFTLLSDPDHRVATIYGAWREKNMYGKKTIGMQRSTYVLDAQGHVRRVWKQVQVKGHEQHVLKAVRSLGG